MNLDSKDEFVNTVTRELDVVRNTLGAMMRAGVRHTDQPQLCRPSTLFRVVYEEQDDTSAVEKGQ